MNLLHSPAPSTQRLILALVAYFTGVLGTLAMVSDVGLPSMLWLYAAMGGVGWLSGSDS